MPIGYNPHRISPPRGIFQPISEDEARFYLHSCQNPLRTRPPPFPTLFSAEGRRHPELQPQSLEAPPSPISYAPASPILLGTVAAAAVSPVVKKGKKRKMDEAELPDRPDGRDGFPDRNGGSRIVNGSTSNGRISLVADHYNARPNTDVFARSESPIIALRSFNNWVKSVLIGKFAAGNSPAKRHPGGVAHRGMKVLDLGCGKGGDLMKWDKAGTHEYFGLDIAHVSIQQAQERFSNMTRARFSAHFSTLDCFQYPLASALSEKDLFRPFDVVSMQFCMHYAFESEAKVRIMLENVSRYLDRGGTFIGTVPNDEKLLQLLNSIPPDDPSLEAGNSVYRITFDSRRPFEEKQVYGVKYRFFLYDAVDDVPEYVVFWDHFVALAEEYGLHLLYRDEFHYLYMNEQQDPEFGRLLKKMKVVDEDGNSPMDAEQWEAANLYIAFAFEKR